MKCVLSQVVGCLRSRAKIGTLLFVGFYFSTVSAHSEVGNFGSPSGSANVHRSASLLPPKCEDTGGTYKNVNGDIATVSIEEQGAANESRVNIFLKQQGHRQSLTFTYFTPNGYGIRTTSDKGERSVYYVNVGGWLVAVFGEGSPLWYSEPRVSVPDSAWFQVLCRVDIKAAKPLSLPTVFIKNNI
jgi:hypothetical protein